MNTPLRITMVIFLFFAAIACYTFGAPAGGVAFIILGLACEGLFWVGIFGKTQKKPKIT